MKPFLGQWRLIISSSISVDELVWARACDDRPKTETSHPLPGFFDHQRLRAVVRHVEPDALVLTDLRNLRFNRIISYTADFRNKNLLADVLLERARHSPNHLHGPTRMYSNSTKGPFLMKHNSCDSKPLPI